MSNAITTPMLRFPSGRLAGRLARDARKDKISLNEMADKAGLKLPWNVAINYLRDKESLSLNGDIKDQYTAAPLVPKLGRVNFVLGTPGSFVNQTALQALMICSKVHHDKPLGYCDYSIENRNDVPSPMHFSRSSVFVDGPMKVHYMDELKKLRRPWEKSFDFVRKNSSKFVAAKLPHQFRFKKAQSAIVAMNPRKAVLGALGSHIQDKALLIADNQANSMMRIGDVKHWGQLSDKRCANDRRNLLQNTDVISEQRGLRLGNEIYLMRRSVQLTDAERAAFADESVSMREVLESLNNRMDLWIDVVEGLDEKYGWEQRLGGFARRYGEQLDSNSSSGQKQMDQNVSMSL